MTHVIHDVYKYSPLEINSVVWGWPEGRVAASCTNTILVIYGYTCELLKVQIGATVPLKPQSTVKCRVINVQYKETIGGLDSRQMWTTAALVFHFNHPLSLCTHTLIELWLHIQKYWTCVSVRQKLCYNTLQRTAFVLKREGGKVTLKKLQ